MKYQNLRQVYKVTEWRENCVFKTRTLGYAWITEGLIPDDKSIQYHSPSTNILMKHSTIRRVSDDTADVVEVTL